MNADYDSLYLFINGEWIAASERDTAPVVNPATLQELGRVPLATAADLDLALRTAKRAFDVWRNTAPAERARILKAGADLIRERATHIAELLTLEEGKPLAESRDEVLRAAEYFEWFGEEARRIDGRVVPSNRPRVQQLVKKQAIGPVAAFTPWNFPAITPARKLSAALAAGCSVIIKPGEESPATALALARALDDAGLPKGVLQVVFGVPDEVSKTLIASPIIRKVTFTGSVPIGRLLAARAAEGVKPITLELGGHGPVLVFKDADVERAAVEGAANRFRGTGQVCISSTRFLIQRESTTSSLATSCPLPRRSGWATACSPARRSARSQILGRLQRWKNSSRMRWRAAQRCWQAASASRGTVTSSNRPCSPTCRWTPA